MGKKLLLSIAALFCVLMVMGQDRSRHFINDTAYRGQVEKDFVKQQLIARGRAAQLFKVFDNNLSLEEEEALKFLYAYMPLSDLADYDGNFFLGQVRMSLLAKKTFSWGDKISDDIFRHFVLPYRVNNENLDSARTVIFGELKDRIKNLSMHDAALEVNHWCHEKVSYKPTDGRTSAPLSTIRTAYGRCGEESTLAVTAFRAVGIPARQVYTPRWAHCDDNHAWVEVWVDGKWHFLGACEPEPDLDIAWFAAPVLRAMLCNTTVFGKYRAAEESLKSDDQFTQINLIENYAPAKKLFVKTVDTNSRAVAGAVVEFQLYNYAEFYPLAKKNTDDQGLAFLTTGLGDLLIWAYKGDTFGYIQVSVGKTDTAVVVLNKSAIENDEVIFTLVPPIERQPKVAEAKGKKENEKRLQNEDKIRGAYEAGFIDSVSSCRFAQNLQLNTDTVWMFLKQSRGNWNEIMKFIQAGVTVNKTYTLQILSGISQKDLRDTPHEVLLDHLQYSDMSFTRANNIPLDQYYSNVLNPRIAGELLSAYKKYFQQEFDKNTIAKMQTDPALIVNYVKENIAVSATGNYSRNPLKPTGTHQLKMADAASRDIYFVALCRSFGIPARINPATKCPEYIFNNQWNQVYFEKNDIVSNPKADLTLTVDTSSIDFKPLYYTHFTIARLEKGVYRSLDYEESTLFDAFPATVALDAGYYMVVTGIRNKDGSVNTRLHFFQLGLREQKSIQLNFIQQEEKPQSMGSLPLSSVFGNSSGMKTQTLETLSGQKGIIIGWLDPDREPTKHTMSDFKLLSGEFEKWGGGILFLLPEDKAGNVLNESTFQGLPTQSVFGVDKYGLLALAEKNLKSSFNNNYPVFVVVDKDGQILDFSCGYKIGRGEQLVKMLKHLD
ncbi:MAG TPA: transglutaminase domain-containing protein [Bacteroidales bacterium]|nr:transglutaminase domain-containing protein [Bacteroidales bacterium]HPI29220.1 transglutaminase domain-containing protein [Bacteroidales bacterium]